ncbi:MAG: energy transducer TonB [Pseudomonadota bacterium]|nr:energy transducer TonB [Pseudomonadota bacterium]
MVNTISTPRIKHDNLRLDPARISGLSAAIAVHVIALGLLTLSVQPPAATPIVEPRTPVVMIEPKPEPTEKPPVELPIETKPISAMPKPPVAQPAPPIITHSETARAVDIAVVPATTESLITVPDTGATAAETGGGHATPVTGIALQYRHNPPPLYPREALRQQWQGTVLLRVTVDEAGNPVQVEIETSSGHRVLDRAARDQVLRQWKFVPAMHNGHAMRAIGRVPVSFALSG